MYKLSMNSLGISIPGLFFVYISKIRYMKEGVEVIIDPQPIEKTTTYKGSIRIEGKIYLFEVIQVSTFSPKNTLMEVNIDYEFHDENLEDTEKYLQIQEMIKYHIAQHDIW